MKTNNLKSVVSIMFIAMLMITNVTFAQKSNGCCEGNKGKQHKKEHSGKDVDKMVNNIPDITDSQKKQIKTLRIDTKKDMLPLKNKLNEQNARLKTLSNAEEADIDAINKQIDKISKTKNQMMKRSAKTNQDIRALLTEDQRVYWDTQKAKRKGHKKNKGHDGRSSSCGK